MMEDLQERKELVPSEDGAETSMAEDKFNCWFVTTRLGGTSEPWMWRQAVGMTRAAVTIVCWDYQNRELFPVGARPIHLMDFPPRPMHDGRRWMHRARNIRGRNFFGSVGAEKAALSSLMSDTKPDVILCQYGGCALRLLPVAEAHGVPLVPHFHGLDITSMVQEDRWYRWSLLRALPKFAAIVVVGDHQRQILLKFGVPDAKIHVIPCGVPVEQFEAAHDLRRQPCRFLSVGRFVPKKSPESTLRAFAACAQRHEGVTLRMVGDGPLHARAVALAAELGIGDGVTFLGSCTNEEVRREMREASVFLQHSVTAESGDMEGWPVALGEAAASGLPAVATRHGGIVQQIAEGSTGFLVDEYDWEEMGRAMSELAGDPGMRERFGANARARAVEQFDIRDRVAELEEVLASTV